MTSGIQRTLGLLGFSLLAGTAIWFGRDIYLASQERERLAAENAEVRARIAELLDRKRVATVYVESITEGADPTEPPRVRLLWAPTDDAGELLAGAEVQSLEVLGRDVHFKALQILFDGDPTKPDDPLQSGALTIFSSAYGDHQPPIRAIPLEVPQGFRFEDSGPAENADLVPPAYRIRDERLADAERRLWAEFWRLAASRDAQRAQGIRAVQGSGVNRPLQAGKSYRLNASLSGQLTLEGPYDPPPFATKGS